MKKLSLLSLFGLLAVAVSVPAVARDINVTDVYIYNKTANPIEVSQPKWKETQDTARGYKTKDKVVGKALVIQPNTRKK